MDSQYTKQILSNGLTLITVPMPQVESVTALVMVRVGSRHETARTRGISHFLEHMVFKGTEKYPNSLALSSTVDGVGAEFNAFTSKEWTGFFVKSAAKHLRLALEILSQLVFYPLIDASQLEKEKGVIIEEINMYEDHPMSKVANDFETLLYGRTSLGWEAIGTKETIRAAKREDFIKFMRKWYQPANMVIGIAGAIPQAESLKLKAKSLVEKYFICSRFNLVSSKVEPYTQEKLFSPFSQKKPAIKIRYKKTEQAHLCLGVRTFKRTHKDRYALAVLATILGGNMSSRLFIEVREKRGLVYYVRTRPQAYIDNGYLVTQAGTDIGKVGETIRVILEEYQKVKSQKSKVKKKELTRAKEFLKGRLVLELEDSQEVASFFVEDWLMEKRIQTPAEVMKKVDQVKIEDLARIARRIFLPQNLNLSIIGPYKDGDRQRFEKIVNL